MSTIRWYGPTVLLLATVLSVMFAGPGLVRRLEWTRTDASIQFAREHNAKSPALADLNAAFRNVARIVKPSVVHIQVFRKTRGGLSQRERDMINRMLPEDERKEEPEAENNYEVPQAYGNGSGWVYDDKGHIVTNYHVIEGADKIVVRFGDGTERLARIVGEPDEKTDIAVLKVKAGDLHPATIAAASVDQGEIVFAFGSPFRFEFSMSQGVVSGIGRELGILRGRRGYENFIQTDASINPGNSGGPLTNINGEVVGMNTAIATRSGGNQGLGFAIPIGMVDDVVQWIIKQGRVRRGYLGVYIDDLDPKMARTFGFDGIGVLVMTPIKGSPGEKAGIESGDIITKVDDRVVTSAQHLRRVIARHAPGTEVALEIFRDGKKLNLTLVVGEQEDSRVAPPRRPVKGDGKGDAGDDEPKIDKKKLLRQLGFEQVQPFNEEIAGQVGLKFAPGVLVRTVRPNSAAAAAGIGRGHIITHVMDKPVKTIEELVDALAEQDLFKGVRLSTKLNGLTRFVLLEWVE